MSPFINKNYLGFNSFLKRKNYDSFCLVMNKATGEFDFDGDIEMAQKFISKKLKDNRRSSNDWVPETDIKLTKPLDQILNNLKDVRQFSSYLLHQFLGNKQKLGQVTT